MSVADCHSKKKKKKKKRTFKLKISMEGKIFKNLLFSQGETGKGGCGSKLCFQIALIRNFGKQPLRLEEFHLA